MAQIFYVCADILDRCECHGRKHFMGSNISWAQIFHGREYFMGANISWARIFHGHEYFEVCVIIIILGKRQYFDNFVVSSA